ncbi:MAG: FtsX-like permease family protein [Bacteroidetes bacterium]|nr:FtsX-like permease family protein [Bacteroidota bacterium]
MQPLSDIHLHSRGYRGGSEVGDMRYIYLSSTIALLVLLIACINYMNLATARSTHRAREVGMRKTLGAQRRQLVGQFMSESILLSLLALVWATMLVELALPYFNDLIGRTLVVDYMHDIDMLAFFLGTALVTGLLAGTYPAFFLSRYTPVRVLKGLRDRGGQAMLRKGLVVVQVGITVALLVGTLVIYNQMRYIQTKNLGFDTEQIISIRKRGLQTDVETFKQAVLDLPGVVRVSASSGIPINGGWMSNSDINGQKVTVSRILIDEDYVETMGLEIVTGRDFSGEHPTDRTHALLVNETMVTLQGWEDPLAQTLPLGKDSTGTPIEANIIGVVRDFHTSSLHNAILPATLDPRKNSVVSTFLVRIRPDDIPGTLAELEATWQRFVPDHPFSYFFVNDVVEALYRADQRFGNTFAAFTALAILIAGLGLFGLAAFTAEQRTKEIGIRKVLGATVSSITFLLSKDFAKLVILAVVLAVPVAYLSMDHWLENFAYRIDLGASVFLLAGALVLVAALLTVSYQAIKAALADYGVTVKKEIEAHTARVMTLGAVHATLYRLQDKGLLTSSLGGANEKRGDRRKRLFVVTSAGFEALRAGREVREKMWSLIPPKLTPGLS